MRILVIGGTQFVGRHLVEAALAAGHDVTLFHRGRTGADLFADAGDRVEHRLGDRDGDLSALADGRWDATVDVCAYVPRQVRSLADVLGLGERRGGRYVQVSSISAYAEPDGPGITEDAPLEVLANPDVEEVTAQTYGGLKALCELAAVESFGTDSLVVRPTYVVGPYDPTGRFTSWVRRIGRGGRVAVPGPLDQPVQVVDARDLAAFMVGLVERGASGALHAAAPAPPHSLGDLLDAVASAVAPPGTELVEVSPEAVRALDLPVTRLPLWHGGARSGTGAVDPSAAFAAGLTPRPVAESARDVLDDPDTPLRPGVGLDDDEERRLLAG